MINDSVEWLQATCEEDVEFLPSLGLTDDESPSDLSTLVARKKPEST
jgi:hypothetical protein